MFADSVVFMCSVCAAEKAIENVQRHWWCFTKASLPRLQRGCLILSPEQQDVGSQPETHRSAAVPRAGDYAVRHDQGLQRRLKKRISC